MSTSTRARVLAPAKINLGLEIIGRREDGFHEIESVLAMVELKDELRFTVNEELPGSRISGMPDVAQDDNLITRAIAAFSSHTGNEASYDVHVSKNIPAPSGLGGGSSNAAATLLALNRLHGDPLSADELHLLGAKLGSDVPFFLGSPAAVASGVGTTLAPLPTPKGWVLIVVPSLNLPAKTRMLYGKITPDDFTGGERVRRVAESIRDERPVLPRYLHNAFERPLRVLAPYIENLVGRMVDAGCPHVALSGAGPAHYSVFPHEEPANIAADRMRESLRPHEHLFIVPFRSTPLLVEL